jgi:hypothetical protein
MRLRTLTIAALLFAASATASARPYWGISRLPGEARAQSDDLSEAEQARAAEKLQNLRKSPFGQRLIPYQSHVVLVARDGKRYKTLVFNGRAAPGYKQYIDVSGRDGKPTQRFYVIDDPRLRRELSAIENQPFERSVRKGVGQPEDYVAIDSLEAAALLGVSRAELDRAFDRFKRDVAASPFIRVAPFTGQDPR